MVDEAVGGLTKTPGRPPNIRDIVDRTRLSHDEALQTVELDSVARPLSWDKALQEFREARRRNCSPDPANRVVNDPLDVVGSIKQRR